MKRQLTKDAIRHTEQDNNGSSYRKGVIDALKGYTRAHKAKHRSLRTFSQGHNTKDKIEDMKNTDNTPPQV